MHGDAAARQHKVNGLIVLRLGEPHRLFIEQHAGVTKAGAEPGIIFQRPDAAVDIDRRIALGIAGVGNRDLLVTGAVRREHIGDGTDKLCPLGVTHATQVPLPAPARKRERAFEIEALRGHRGELVAFDGIAKACLDTLSTHPTAGEITFKRLGHRRHGNILKSGYRLGQPPPERGRSARTQASLRSLRKLGCARRVGINFFTFSSEAFAAITSSTPERFSITSEFQKRRTVTPL
jgi:hypothetical protein